MTTEIATVQTALDKLNRSLDKDSLDSLVAARTRRSLLLVDVSGSMADYISEGGRKIDKLRKVVANLREQHPVPVAAFGGRSLQQVEVVDVVPEPAGGTPLAEAIDFASAQGATHLVVVTDGVPNDEDRAFQSARAFNGQIDVFYIGDGRDRGSAFAAELAKLTGGKCGLTDLSGEPKALAGRIMLALGDGSEAL